MKTFKNLKAPILVGAGLSSLITPSAQAWTFSGFPSCNIYLSTGEHIENAQIWYYNNVGTSEDAPCSLVGGVTVFCNYFQEVAYYGPFAVYCC